MKNIVTFLILSYALTALGADEAVPVYQLNGALQCAQGGGISPEGAADLLRGQGVKVFSAEQRGLPVDPAEHCGAPTGEANVISVAATDWAAFTAKNADAGGYGLWVFDSSEVEVFRYDGSLQCGMGNETPLDEMAEALTGAGIEVLDSRKGTDGRAHIAVCGASTGRINVYKIQYSDLPAARQAGYNILVTRDLTQRIKPRRPRPMGMQGMQARPMPREQQSRPPIPLLW